MTRRTVLDTNVVLSALLFEGGRVSWLRRAWLAGAVRPLVSRETVAELVRALAYPKFGLGAGEIEEILGEYLPYAEGIDPTAAPAGLPVCSDPDDQMFLAVAAAGGADLLVTGDRALLALDGAAPFRIVSPARAREMVVEDQGL